MLGAQVGPVKVDIPNLGVAYPALDHHGRGRGHDDRLPALRRQESRRRLDRALLRRRAGDRQRQARPQVHVAARQAGRASRSAATTSSSTTQLRLPGVPALSQVNGHLEFAERAMQSRDLSAEVFGGPAKIAVATPEGGVRVDRERARESRHAERRVRRADAAPCLRHDRLAAHGAGARAKARAGRSSRTCKGANVELPAPIGKVAAETAPLRIERREAAGKGPEDTLTIDYRGDLRVVAHRDARPRTRRASIARCSCSAPPSRAADAADRPGLWVRGADRRLRPRRVARALREGSRRGPAPGARAAQRSPGALELNGVDIEVGRVDVFGRVLHDLKVNARARGQRLAPARSRAARSKAPRRGAARRRGCRTGA